MPIISVVGIVFPIKGVVAGLHISNPVICIVLVCLHKLVDAIVLVNYFIYLSAYQVVVVVSTLIALLLYRVSTVICQNGGYIAFNVITVMYGIVVKIGLGYRCHMYNRISRCQGKGIVHRACASYIFIYDATNTLAQVLLNKRQTVVFRRIVISMCNLRMEGMCYPIRQSVSIFCKTFYRV